MSPEAPNEKIVQNLNGFLESHYPLKSEAVDETIKYARNLDTRGLSLPGYIMAQVEYVASHVGVEDLPVMLAALWKIENEVPADERRLTPKRYIGMLMIGEITSSVNETKLEDSLSGSLDHAIRADTLFQFWKTL